MFPLSPTPRMSLCPRRVPALPLSDEVLAGLCVAEPQQVTVTQDVRVALRLPPSIRPREQLQLQPLIHSRLPRSINVSPIETPIGTPKIPLSLQ